MDLPINIDVSGCLEERLDALGLSESQLACWQELADQTHQAIRAEIAEGLLAMLSCTRSLEDLTQMQDVVARFRRDFDHVVVLGTGGSSLGGATLCRLVDEEGGQPQGAPRVEFLDSIDPWAVERLSRRIDPARTGVIAISKSGGTAETIAQLLILSARFEDALGREEAARHFVAVSDPNPEDSPRPLRQIAEKKGWICLDHHPTVGGRYSALTLTGLLPAAIAGVDVTAVRAGAASVLDSFEAAPDGLQADAILGAVIGLVFWKEKHVSQSVVMPYLDRLNRFGRWYRQLWAESLGKQGHGTTPIDAQGPVDQHSQLQLYLDGPHDKLFTLILGQPGGSGATMSLDDVPDLVGSLDYLSGRSIGDLLEAEQRATAETLIRNGRPTRVISLRDKDATAEAVGALMMHFMLETIATAMMLGIDGFDQPAVEESKVLARRYLKEGTH